MMFEHLSVEYLCSDLKMLAVPFYWRQNYELDDYAVDCRLFVWNLLHSLAEIAVFF